MNNDSIEKRLQHLEDIEAIRKLKALYCFYADQPGSDYADKFAELFVEDAEIDEGEDLGVLRGRDQIRWAHREFWQHLRLNQHLTFNALIDVDGNKAHGRWKLLQLTTSIVKDGDKAFWSCGSYDEQYVKKNGVWKFQHVQAAVHFTCPYEDGWVRTPDAHILPPGIVAGFPDRC
jgi:hypothetical protein